MSSESGLIGETEARRKAEEVLAFKIGNLPHLGEPEEEDEEFVFPLVTNMPRVIFDEDRRHPIDVKFMSSDKVGEIRIDKTTGEIVDRSHVYQIERKIRAQRMEIEEAVEKALVRSSATRFSRLPFPEHRYTPILDILSHLILEGPISSEELQEMNASNEQKYRDYVEMLDEVDLVRERDDGQIEADNIFIELQAQEDTHPEMLNAALAHFFEKGAEHIETIRSILGPYLVLAGYYYQRALEVDGYPKIPEQEFVEEIEKNYSGEDRVQKKFKISRYLIQLEEVELLESNNQAGSPTWSGRESVKQNLLREDQLLDPIAEVMA